MKKFLFTLLIGLILLPSLSFADGGMFPPHDYYVYETGQKAAIYYKNNEETLVLSTSFEGDAKDFSWIIPTPSQPDVTKVSKDIFANLEKMTLTEDVYANKSQPAYGLGEAALDTVEVLEQKQIGYYDVTILKSSDENALYDWLNENGYQYPQDGKYLLDDYVRLGWVFTAVKITDDALTSSSIQEKMYNGDMSPLRLVFSSENMVFPLKISGITQYTQEYKDLQSITNDSSDATAEDTILPYYSTGMPIELYIFADNKKDLSGFTTEYASWVNPDEINKLATDEQGNSWVNTDQKMYLTKMYRYMELSQMDEDLYPQDATNNDTIGVLSWWEKGINWAMQYIGIVLLILILMYFIPIYWQFKTASKTCHVLSWISQIVSFIFLGVLPLIYALTIALELFTYGGYTDFSTMIIGIPYIIMPLMMLVLLIAEGVWQKKNIQR